MMKQNLGKLFYKIESRYKGFVNARIETWYGHYWEFINDSEYPNLPIVDKNHLYFKFLAKDESLQLS